MKSLLRSLALFSILILMLISSPNLFAQGSNVELKNSNGETTSGRIVSIEIDSLTIENETSKSAFSFDQIESIDFGVTAQLPPETSTAINLLDGSSIKAASFTKKSGTLSTVFQCDLKHDINSRYIGSVVFKNYENEIDLAKQFREILRDDSREGDAIVVNRAGELSTVEGVSGDLVDGKMAFSIGDRTAQVALSKMEAILFYHADSRDYYAKAICEVLLPDQSRILARKLAWNESQLEVTSVCGAQFQFPSSILSKVNFSLGRSVFLSDLAPSTNDWQPLMASSRIYEKLRKLKLARINQSFSGQPLSLKIESKTKLSFAAERKQFEKGFAIHAGGKLAFSLKGQYDRLTGLVGFDPEANTSGDVSFKVLIDGNLAFEKRMVNQKMDNPLELDLDLKDAKRIVFQVDYQDARSVGDQLHLVNLKASQ
ncbi:MAG: NPCBM/NEW2 domain-containing protein [Mariniblastus sp.]